MFPLLNRFIFTKIQKMAELTPWKITGFSFETSFIDNVNKYKHLKSDWGIHCFELGVLVINEVFKTNSILLVANQNF